MIDEALTRINHTLVITTVGKSIMKSAAAQSAEAYRVMVRIVLARYRGSFNTRTFGEKKPHIGFCHEGQLELVYHKDLGLKAGQPFPLWTIQYQSNSNKGTKSDTEITRQRDPWTG